MHRRPLPMAACTLVVCLQAHALQPTDDFFVHIKNDTNQTIEICNRSLTFCKALRVGDVSIDAQATQGQREKFLETWLGARAVKGCGKTVALKDVAVLTQKLYDRGAVVYVFSIEKRRYANQCSRP
jgi:hypothetical protein